MLTDSHTCLLWTQRLLVRSGWLYEYSDSGTQAWTKRYDLLKADWSRPWSGSRCLSEQELRDPSHSEPHGRQDRSLPRVGHDGAAEVGIDSLDCVACGSLAGSAASIEMTYHCSNMIQEAHVLSGPSSSWEQPDQFALRVCIQDTEKTIILSATSADELQTWKDLPIQLRVMRASSFFCCLGHI